MAAPHPLSELPAGYGTLSILICFRIFLGYGRVQLRPHGLAWGRRLNSLITSLPYASLVSLRIYLQLSFSSVD